MRFRGQYRHEVSFAKALLKANQTMVEMAKHSTTQAKSDNLAFFLQYLIVLMIVVMALMLWYDCRPQYEEYPINDVHEIKEEFEDWLLRLEDLDDENTPLFASSYRSVRETPLSPNEVRRLTDLIRADEQSGYGTIVSRKRKAAEDSDSSDIESPPPRRLKVETDMGFAGRWVSDQWTASPSVMSHKNTSDSYPVDCESPFTFRLTYPDSMVKAAMKQRK
ncbi:MAG: hypothetical protein L6R40_003465 [Gallowayella cf. fulva]|nr:MAG: hypothetical protein L6R40_003465 [Xanthomendoza cf. fulva]